MLNYDKLENEANALIDKLTKQDFENWLIKDDLRLQEAFLSEGFAYIFGNDFKRITPSNKEFANPLNAGFFMTIF